MYRLLFFCLLAGLIAGCDKDDDHKHTEEGEYKYHIHISAPDDSDKALGDAFTIGIEFESETQQPVHHVNVSIREKLTGSVIYSKPTEAHVHATAGIFNYGDVFILNTTNGFKTATAYVLEARVWGHEDDLEEVIESLEFQIQ